MYTLLLFSDFEISRCLSERESVNRLVCVYVNPALLFFRVVYADKFHVAVLIIEQFFLDLEVVRFVSFDVVYDQFSVSVVDFKIGYIRDRPDSAAVFF